MTIKVVKKVSQSTHTQCRHYLSQRSTYGRHTSNCIIVFTSERTDSTFQTATKAIEHFKCLQHLEDIKSGVNVDIVPKFRNTEISDITKCYFRVEFDAR